MIIICIKEKKHIKLQLRIILILLLKNLLMCELCSNQTVSKTRTRCRIWEMANNSHCSVIGTCLTISDLRALARKLKIKTLPGVSPDYQLHGFFVQEAVQNSTAAKMLNKLLDKRHASSIRKVRGLNSESTLERHWDEALNTGDIPGPYWAILSHPSVSKKLADRMFADVHMLSHLVGASNRSDIRRLRESEEKSAKLEHRVSRQGEQHIGKLAERDKIIKELRSKIRYLEVTGREKIQSEIRDKYSSDKTSKFLAEISQLSSDLITKDALIIDANKKIERLEKLATALRLENTSLEEALDCHQQKCKEANSFDLRGKCVLYVGGRQQTVHRLRSLVSKWNGELLHHDGGIERSMDELANALNKADAVVFPTDCVSHSAANTVKRLCNQSMKPFFPLRTSGVASFVASLKEGQLSYVPD